MKKSILFLVTIFYLFSDNLESSEPSKAIVVTANPYASEAAANIIRMGGSAVDAAITAQLILTLTTPQATGIGGGGFMLYWDNDESKLYAIDGREKAPFSADQNLFLNKDGNVMDFYPDAVVGGKSVGVPGLVKLMEEAHQRFGRLDWNELFNEPIKLAEEGFKVSPALHRTLSYMRYLKKIEPASSLYYQNDSEGNNIPLDIGSSLINSEYAKTLKRISKLGSDDFYDGKTTELIINAIKNSIHNPIPITREDFKNYNVIWREPLCLPYREFNICGMPPPSGGISVLMILKMLENYDIKYYKPTSPEFIHIFSEVTALAYADRDFFNADPDFIDIPVEGLLDNKYLNDRTKKIDLKKSNRNPKHGKPSGYNEYSRNVDISMPSTSHLVIVDLYGNAVSITSTIEGPFGSHLMAGGFMLNNELTDFSLMPEKDGISIANRVESGKRPRSSMSPTIIFDKHGEIHSLTGSPGGNSIIGYVAKSILGLLDWNMSPQEVVAIPHYLRRNKNTELEKNTILPIHKDYLENLGHEVVVVSKRSGLHIAKKVGKGFIGGADPRREGLVIQIDQ